MHASVKKLQKGKATGKDVVVGEMIKSGTESV